MQGLVGKLLVSDYDRNRSPCACFADDIAIATLVCMGQRSLTIAPETRLDSAAAIARQRR